MNEPMKDTALAGNSFLRVPATTNIVLFALLALSQTGLRDWPGASAATFLLVTVAALALLRISAAGDPETDELTLPTDLSSGVELANGQLQPTKQTVAVLAA